VGGGGGRGTEIWEKRRCEVHRRWKKGGQDLGESKKIVSLCNSLKLEKHRETGGN